MNMSKKIQWGQVAERVATSHERVERAMQGAIAEALKSMPAARSGGPAELPADLLARVAHLEDVTAQQRTMLEAVSSKTPRPIVVEVTSPKGGKKTTTEVEGAAHRNLPHLLRMVGARLNVALIGEAGSGKTHATEQVAKTLGLKYWPMSFHSKMTATDLRGYMDATGTYRASALYMAMKEGGMLVLDEFDRSNTEVTVSLNQALANGRVLFPNGELVEKHPDFVVVACQNTTGSGASKQYAAAQRQDASTLNRFVRLEWNIDEELELAVCGNTAATKAVQKARAKARELGMDLVISPRQAFHANTLVGLGYTLEQAMAYSVWECLAPDQVERLKKCL